MLALAAITPWHWAVFIACVVCFLALDLGVFHRKAHLVQFREAFLWVGLWFTLAMLFALGLKFTRGRQASLEFMAGYLIELSLSMDNVFVISLIFGYFRIPAIYQHRVLFWGILGALGMRGAMIGAGVALVNWLSWVLYIFGALLIYNGILLLFAETKVQPEKNIVIRIARAIYPVTTHLDGQKFSTRFEGKRALTPLALVLLMVETCDLIFAADSIPAIFAVTTKPFVIFTSNVFAILGLRSLYFVLAGAMAYFKYLKAGLSMVLVFIGMKMLIDPHDSTPMWFQRDVSTAQSLIAIVVILTISIIASLWAAWRERTRQIVNP
jgi:tellurite resistance protein TerC